MTAHVRTTKRRKRRPGKGKMALSAAQVTLPATTWDRGAMGPANRHGLVEEDAPTIDPETGEAHNPNGVKRLRRVDMIEVWANNGRHQAKREDGILKPWIDARQYNVAVMLRASFEITQMGRAMDYSQERVDSSPKPDHAVTIQIDRVSRYHLIAKHVAAQDEGILYHCVIQGAAIGSYRNPEGVRPYYGAGSAKGMQHLRDALDRLADGLRC